MPIYMNLKAWNELPPDIQKIFDEASGLNYTLFCGKTFDALDLEYRATLEKYLKGKGLPPVYDLPKDEKTRWVEAVQVVYENWMKDLEEKGLGEQAKAMVADAKALVKKFAK
jgi:TRAP-type C4-dicarboxylate transport system substrate-binding protein